jgi:hypothetical protein
MQAMENANATPFRNIAQSGGNGNSNTSSGPFVVFEGEEF